MHYPFLILALLGRLSHAQTLSTVGHAQTDPCDRAYEIMLEDQRKPHLLVVAMSRKVTDVEGHFRSVRLNPDTEDEEGSLNAGVIRVQVDGKSYALKLSAIEAFNEPLGFRQVRRFDGTNLSNPRFQDYLVIHRALGELGYAPELKGIFNYPNAKHLIEMFREQGLEIKDRPAVGILMEEIPNAWNLHRSDVIPDYVKYWTESTVEQLVRRVAKMNADLNRLKIHAGDVQFFVTEENGAPRLVFGDLDGFTMQKNGAGRNNFLEEAERVVHAWERATGKHFSDALFQTIMGAPRPAPLTQPPQKASTQPTGSTDPRKP